MSFDYFLMQFDHSVIESQRRYSYIGKNLTKFSANREESQRIPLASHSISKNPKPEILYGPIKMCPMKEEKEPKRAKDEMEQSANERGKRKRRRKVKPITLCNILNFLISLIVTHFVTKASCQGFT